MRFFVVQQNGGQRKRTSLIFTTIATVPWSGTTVATDFRTFEVRRLMQEARVHLERFTSLASRRRQGMKQRVRRTRINAARTYRGQKGPWEAETIPRQDLSVLSDFPRAVREKDTLARESLSRSVRKEKKIAGN